MLEELESQWPAADMEYTARATSQCISIATPYVALCFRPVRAQLKLASFLLHKVQGLQVIIFHYLSLQLTDRWEGTVFVNGQSCMCYLRWYDQNAVVLPSGICKHHRACDWKQ